MRRSLVKSDAPATWLEIFGVSAFFVFLIFTGIYSDIQSFHEFQKRLEKTKQILNNDNVQKMSLYRSRYDYIVAVTTTNGNLELYDISGTSLRDKITIHEFYTKTKFAKDL